MLFTNKSKLSTIFRGYKAFTLAEVLITLGIIGIVAALTIPTLINSIDESKYNTGLKKAFSTLSGALIRIQADQGGLSNIGNGTSTANREALMAEFEPYIVFIRRDTAQNIFGPLHYRTYKSNDEDGFPWGDTTQTAAVTKDGMYLCIWNNPDCNYRGSLHSCASIVVDTNGAEKPNMYGLDVHVFEISYKNGVQVLTPDGTTGDGMTCVPGNPNWQFTSFGCTALRLFNPSALP